jgi:hypothetical protein
LLPPFGDEEVHNNYPYRRWVIAWLVDPTTNKRLPFASPYSAGEDACPVHEYSKLIKDQIDALVAKEKTGGGLSEAEDQTLENLKKINWDIKNQQVYAYNAVTKDGKIGLLEVKSTAHKGIKKRMLEYITEVEMDPTSLSDEADDRGVWLKITKEGSGTGTTYEVNFNTIRKKGSMDYSLDVSPLPEGVADNFAKAGYDLSKLYRQKSYEELRDILLYNIALVAEELPEAVQPGFEPEGASLAAVEEVEEAAPVAKKSKPKVNLAIDTDDLEDEAPVAKARPASSNIDDLIAEANSILED